MSSPTQEDSITTQPLGQTKVAFGESSHPETNSHPEGRLQWGELVTVIHGGKGHSGKRPSDCERCGQDVASLLRDHLSVSARNSAQYHFGDVMVLTRNKNISDVNPFIQGLRGKGVPVCVLAGEEDPALYRVSGDMAVAGWEGLICPDFVKPVVVFLHSQPPGAKSRSADQDRKTLDCLRAGRVQQLVLVQPPDRRKRDSVDYDGFVWDGIGSQPVPYVNYSGLHCGGGGAINPDKTDSNRNGCCDDHCNDFCEDCLLYMGFCCCHGTTTSSSLTSNCCDCNCDCDCDCGDCDIDCGDCNCSGDCVIL